MTYTRNKSICSDPKPCSFWSRLCPALYRFHPDVWLLSTSDLRIINIQVLCDVKEEIHVEVSHISQGCILYLVGV